MVTSPIFSTDKPKRGRPKIHYDRRAYKTAKQREYRALAAPKPKIERDNDRR